MIPSVSRMLAVSWKRHTSAKHANRKMCGEITWCPDCYSIIRIWLSHMNYTMINIIKEKKFHSNQWERKFSKVRIRFYILFIFIFIDNFKHSPQFYSSYKEVKFMFTLNTSPTKKILVFLKNYKIQITDIARNKTSSRERVHYFLN